MKKLLWLLALVPALALGQLYTHFGPSNGVMKGSTTTPQTTTATGADIGSPFTGCSGSDPYMEYTGVCGPGGSGGSSIVTAIHNSSNTTRSTTGVSDDPHLTFTGLAATRWFSYVCNLYYSTASTNSFVIAMDVTQGASGGGFWTVRGSGVTESTIRANGISSTVNLTGTSGSVFFAQIIGSIVFVGLGAGSSVTVAWSTGTNSQNATMESTSNCILTDGT